MDLNNALEEAKLAICYFFNNKFDEARILLQPYAHVSMYHSMGNAVFIFLEAILTFEQRHIVRAGDELKKCLSVCQRYMHKNTFTQSIGRKFNRVCKPHTILVCSGDPRSTCEQMKRNKAFGINTTKIVKVTFVHHKMNVFEAIHQFFKYQIRWN
uniref:Tetratricopeptide repeat protein 39B n=2 Tax=Bactrocera latifrons TaxID=174628 RepID=A0A0K8WHY7_BACLA